jgi:glycosyltransferase involved in cell wall biosynthesis
VEIALDATYSLGKNLSGVGVYSREMMFGLANAHPSDRFSFYYRTHRLLRSLSDSLPRNARRRVLSGPPKGDIFHALNQRVDSRAKRTVTTFHDLFVMTGGYSSPDFRLRFTEQAKTAAKNSDLIIAVSSFTGGQVETLLGVPRDRIRVIPHGVRPPAELRPQRENIVLFVGAIQKRKNVGRLIRAFDLMPSGWRLVLAGAPDGYGAQEELKALEKIHRVQDVEVKGYVSAHELEELYRRARIFAFPSLDEGFGMPVLEAMAHGVAVLASRRSAIPEVAGDAAFLVDPTDIGEMAEALRLLAVSAEDREDLIVRGRARAAKFTWKSAVEQTWAVYQELLTI